MEPRAFQSLTELPLALPSKIVEAVVAFFTTTRPGSSRIKVLPMSGAWLVQYEVAYGKHGDAP